MHKETKIKKLASTAGGMRLTSSLLGALIGSALSGGTTFALSKDKKTRKRNATIAAILGGLTGGTIGLSRVSAPARAVNNYEKAKKEFVNTLRKSKAYVKDNPTFDFEINGNMYDGVSAKARSNPRQTARAFNDAKHNLKLITKELAADIKARSKTPEGPLRAQNVAALSAYPLDTSNGYLAELLDVGKRHENENKSKNKKVNK